MLARIEPSDPESDMPCYPCMVTLRDGRTVDRVYVQAEEPYMKYWGIWPESDRAKQSLPIAEVVEIASSPTRLSPRFATEIYAAGESGMGYTIFTLLFANGYRQAYGVGNAIDFLRYPPGLSPTDVIAVLPHLGRDDSRRIDWGPDYFWCLYSTPDHAFSSGSVN
jgi:hypothetical protein